MGEKEEWGRGHEEILPEWHLSSHFLLFSKTSGKVKSPPTSLVGLAESSDGVSGHPGGDT